MKKVLSLALALMMLLSIMPMSFAAEDETVAEGETTENVVGLENFTKKNSYKPGQFTDFLSSDWFSANVITAYELGLVKGTTETNFNPKGNITVAETIVLACRLHNIYNGGTGEFTQGSPWYQIYVDYALKNKIIPGAYGDYNAKISRENFAFILSNALPADALKEINNIPNGKIPDLYASESVYKLYRAGVLTGSDKYGTFNPKSNIQRSEVATIVTRMADRTQRKMFILEEKPLVPESVTLVGNTTIKVGETTQWKATVAPSRANQWVSWNSGNPGVATVDANGNIKGIKEGQSNITATAVNGVKKTVLLTVVKAESGLWYSEQMYRVGIDIPAGDYYAVATDKYGGYYCKYTDSTQDDIEDNENFSTFTFFRCYDGQYLKLSRCKITPVANAPVNSPDNGVYGEGTYRVGVDMLPGEYKFTQTGDSSGYYCVCTDITYDDIEDNDNFDGTTYYTVKNGQYLTIRRATAVRVGGGQSSLSKQYKYYPGFNGCPDIGAVLGVAPNYVSDDLKSYTYLVEDIERKYTEAEWIALVLDTFEQNGFEYTETTEPEEGIPVFWYDNHKTGKAMSMSIIATLVSTNPIKTGVALFICIYD